MKKDVFVIGINHPQFLLTHRRHLAEQAKRDGFDVVIVCPYAQEVQDVEKLGYRCETIEISRKSLNPFNNLKTVFEFYRVFKKIKPKVYHGFTIKCVFYGTIAAKWAGVKTRVITITGLGSAFLKKGLVGQALRFIIGLHYKVCIDKGTQVVFQNSDDLKLFDEKGWVSRCKKTIIRGTGVDTELYQPRHLVSESSVTTPVILFPARIMKDKGIVELLEACSQLHQQGLNFKLNICGENDQESFAKIDTKYLEKWEKLEFVSFLGFRKDMYQVYNEADIVCLPSYREGIPLALIEASSCGLPIVTTDVPGCREVVSDRENGFLVSAKEVQSLGLALQKLIESEVLRKKLGKNGREKALKFFSKEVIVQENMALYSYDQKAERKKAA